MQTVNDQQQKDGVELIQQIANLHGQLVESHDFAQALQGIRLLQDKVPGAFSSEALEEFENDYRLMADFMLKGFKDPQRNALYGRLVRGMSSLLRNMEVEVERKYDPFFSPLVRLTASTKLDPTGIEQKLVKHVQDVAMLSLDEEQVRQQRSKELYEAHFNFMRNLFNAIVVSSQWNADMAHDMARLLSSPTIDAMDALTLVSAITMATLNVPDPQKAIALTEVFSLADDEAIRQRALVGWVFAVGNDGFALFPEVGERVADLLAKPEVRKEVLQLQKQVVFCQNAARDQETLRNDIMPNIMKNQNFEVSRFGIKEKEEDPMMDILHPDDDRKMEELEASFQKISDMQKRGADIYFGGFSHMKRFSFFYTLCNWFMPFYTEHPQLQHLTQGLLQSNFIKQLMLHGPFCDSDKYSFTLGVSSVFSSLPESLRNMMEQGELQSGMPEGNGPQGKAYIRRKYLQDLYRFAMLNDGRKRFANPFDENHVFCRPRFSPTRWPTRRATCSCSCSSRRSLRCCLPFFRPITMPRTPTTCAWRVVWPSISSSMPRQRRPAASCCACSPTTNRPSAPWRRLASTRPILRRRPSITGLCWRCIPTTATAPSTCRSHFSTVARPTRRCRCSSSSSMSIPTTST